MDIKKADMQVYTKASEESSESEVNCQYYWFMTIIVAFNKISEWSSV